MDFSKNFIQIKLLTCFIWFSVIFGSQNVTVNVKSANLTECDCGWRNSNVSNKVLVNKQN